MWSFFDNLSCSRPSTSRLLPSSSTEAVTEAVTEALGVAPRARSLAGETSGVSAPTVPWKEGERRNETCYVRSFLFLVRPRAPSSVFAPSSDAVCY